MFLKAGVFVSLAVVGPLAAPHRLYVGQTFRSAAEANDATVSGVVKDATTGQPIADAIVQIGPVGANGAPQIQQRQFTDARGRFVFTGLGVTVRSDYQILAARAGYFDGGYGASGEGTWQTK